MSVENFKRLSASSSLLLSMEVCDGVTGVCVVVVVDETEMLVSSRFATDATFFLKSCGDESTRLFNGS